MLPIGGHHEEAARPLSVVLLRVTLFLVVALGTGAALVQVWIDLEQEKGAVELSAEEFLASVTPSAASAAYNFFEPGAEQVVEGLFTQRAVVSVSIENNGQTMVERSREVRPTLPDIGPITGADEVVLRQLLYTPPAVGGDEVIGMITVTVDRSVVPPAVVNRLFSYFLVATLKNLVLGFALIGIVYGALARHIVNLAEAARLWSPGAPSLDPPPPPRLLRGTELELLGQRIREMADAASGRIKEIEAAQAEIERSNTELSLRSESLTQTIEARTAELQRANDRLSMLAEVDELTGLKNRRAFDLAAQEACRAAAARHRQLAVLLIDVDFFKAYNDYYGHQKGDDALAGVGAAIDGVARAHGGLVARYGGEEFVALIENAHAGDAGRYAQRIHAALADADLEHQRSSIGSRLTLSIGASVLDPTHGTPEEALQTALEAADEALYEAKRTGRNRTETSTAEIRESVRRQRQETQELLEAIENDRFEPFFQPQFDASTGRLIGAEALVRWRRRDGTIASPAEFMATAIDNGLVQLMDRRVIEKVGKMLREGERRGAVLPRLSLNAPKTGLHEEAIVQGIIDLAEIGTTRIAVELLETAIVDTLDELFAWQLDRLREAGADIELDDFGTGHTSILGLMKIRPQRLKIAKELIIPIAEDEACASIVKSVIDIGRTLQIDVLAEGVETAAVSKILIGFGCPAQQGFYLARPMPAEELLDLIAGPDAAAQSRS